MSRIKPDCENIKTVVNQLTNAPWLDADRSGWPDFLYHVTGIHNAVSILTTGRILSRDLAIRLGVMHSENANLGIIDGTEPEIHRHARFYFRPRTPTFHNNEGIRPFSQREDAHCAIPVAFLVDAREVLCLDNSQFSDGSLARRGYGRRAERGRTAAFLQSLPFEKVFHDRSLYGLSLAEKDDIIFRRQAEVIVPRYLDVAGLLRHVFVRSDAERETLRSLLANSESGSVHISVANISVLKKPVYFFKKWTFVESVAVANDRVLLTMNPNTETPGPFTVRVQFAHSEFGTPTLDTVQSGISARGTIRCLIPYVHRENSFFFRFMLDDCLAYQNTLDPRPDDTVAATDVRQERSLRA